MKLYRVVSGSHGRGGELPFLMGLTVLAAVAVLASPGAEDFPFVVGVAVALLGLYALATAGGKRHGRPGPPGPEVRR